MFKFTKLGDIQMNETEFEMVEDLLNIICNSTCAVTMKSKEK